MATVRYTLTSTFTNPIRVEHDKYGRAVLVFETNSYDESDFTTAAAAAEHQGAMLREMVEHGFSVKDNNGKEMKYDDNGDWIRPHYDD